MCLKVKLIDGNFRLMEITYLGHSSFKIKGRAATIVTDPFGEGYGLKYPKVEADMVTVSHDHGDHNNAKAVTGVTKVISAPGEYEIKGVSIIGLPTYHDGKKGTERGKNTIYVIEIDGFRLLHLGDLGHKLTDETIKEIGNVDILFIPVGGFYTIDAKEAVEVYKQIGPTIIIPMHYKSDGTGEVLSKLLPLEDFLKESSLRTERLPKLVLKEGATMPEEEYAVVLEKK